MKTQLDPVLSELFSGEADLNEDAVSILYQEIEGYRKGGEGFTFREWRALSQITKIAFMDIGNKMREQEAARVAYYIANPFEINKTLFGEERAIESALTEKVSGPVMDLKTGKMVNP